MSPSPQLTAPGSSTYDGPTMVVGDGTWDATRNNFLLPNLQGLNFATMQYNGMGNRFQNMPGYHNLILAHGVIAAIVFLLLVPTAILVNQFYWVRYRAIRIHIWLQVLALLLTTVLFILGFMAVGPSRSLTNPHHAMGVAIYVALIVQFIGGWWVHSRERKKRLPNIPLRAFIHKQLGRVIGLLGFIQIALGLTLFGSPSYLFILYSLVGAALLLTWLVLSYRRERRYGRDFDSDYSWASGSGSVEGREHGRFGRLAKGAAAGAGIGALANRFRGRHHDASPSRHSGSYLEEEKSSESPSRQREGGWFRRTLGLGALAGGGWWLGRRLARRPSGSDYGSGSYTESDSGSAERVEHRGTEHIEDGHPSPAADQPLNPAIPGAAGMGAAAAPLGHRRSTSSQSQDYDSYLSASPSRNRRRNNILGTLGGLGGIGGLVGAKNWLKGRRERREQQRIDELRQRELEDERVQRAHSKRYTGDGAVPRRGANRAGSGSTDLTPLPGGGAPAPGQIHGGAATASGLDQHGAPPPVPHMAGGALSREQVAAPPPPPIHDPNAMHSSSGSDVFSSGGREHRSGSRVGDAAAASMVGGAAGLAAGTAASDRRHRRRSSSHRRSDQTGGSVGSPPVSVKLNMHGDGRHVTLRRLTEDEAAAERAARAGGAGGAPYAAASTPRRHRRRQAGSVSSLSGTDPSPGVPGPSGGIMGGGGGGGEGWRRNEAQEVLNASRQKLQMSQTHLTPGPSSGTPLPAPPPVPAAAAAADPRKASGAGSVGSPPGTYDGNQTETSTNYENNRRRRRAERAAAARERQAREAKAGGDFD